MQSIQRCSHMVSRCSCLIILLPCINTMREKRGAYKILVEKSQNSRLHETPTRKREDNIRMFLDKRLHEAGERNGLAKYCVVWLTS